MLYYICINSIGQSAIPGRICHKNFLTKCALHQEKQTLLHKKHLLLRGSFPINDIQTFIIGWIAEAYDLPYLDNE